MAAWVDGCRYLPTLGGTTDWTFSSAVTGYMSPALCGIVNGRVYKYRAESADLTQWELGEGAYNTGTGVFARTTVLYNSSGTGTASGQSGAGTKINFTLVPQVAVVAMKEDMLSIEEANVFTAAQINQALKNLGNAALSTAVPQGPVGFGSRLTSSEDLNNVVTDGLYTVEAGCTNQPVASIQYYLLVQKYAAGVGYVSQTAWDINTVGGGAMYMRWSMASIWTAWFQIPRTSVGFGTLGQSLMSAGAGAADVWQSGNRTLLNTLTASNSATLSDTTSLTANYSAYEIDIDEMLAATNGVSFELQIHSGGAFKNTGYLGNFFGFSNGSTTNITGATVTTFIPLIGAASMTNLRPASGRIRVSNPSVNAKHMWFGEIAYGGSSFVGNNIFSGIWDTAGVIDGFQILTSSGNITSGTAKVYGIS